MNFIKPLALISTYLLTLNSYGELTHIISNHNAVGFYIDKNTIKNHGEYVNFWMLTDHKTPISNVFFSTKSPIKGDCDLGRLKFIRTLAYKQPMGKGDFDSVTGSEKKWSYLPPDEALMSVLNYACDYVKQ